MANPFCHIELHTDDTGKSRSFYGELFDWKLEDMPMGEGMSYTMVDVGEEGTGGGMMAKPCEDAPTAWMPYVLVEDCKASAEKATSLGANIVKEETVIPNMGSFVIIADPSGAILGLWQPANAS
jgi:predicted enzyme related to lactoylglutathione lyase